LKNSTLFGRTILLELAAFLFNSKYFNIKNNEFMRHDLEGYFNSFYFTIKIKISKKNTYNQNSQKSSTHITRLINPRVDFITYSLRLFSK